MPHFFTPKAIFSTIGILIIAGITAIFFRTATTFLPADTTLGGVNVGGLTYQSALTEYWAKQQTPTEIILTAEGSSVATSSADSKLTPKPAPALSAALPEKSVDRINWYIKGLFDPPTIPVGYDFHSDQILAQLNQLAEITNIASSSGAEWPSVALEKSGVASSIVVSKGAMGKGVNVVGQQDRVLQEIAQGNTHISIPLEEYGKVLTAEEEAATATAAGQLVGKSITFTAERMTLVVTDQDLVAMLIPPTGFNDKHLEIILDGWESQVRTAPQEPVLELNEDQTEVVKFVPPRNGRTLDRLEVATQVREAWQNMLANQTNTEEKTYTYELKLQEKPPEKSLASTNNLGITERIGFGESHYSHSIPNRIHNVAITTERVNNALIAPGATFSFNKTIGDVSAATGYRSAYVIVNGRTELGDGGGVCQVSTTVFRAIVNSGLNITRRLPHSYRVSYYELDNKPGLDATVYAGETDFRFVNDTENYVLLHAVADSTNTYMYVEVYGTSDGRYTKITEHKVWGASGPPAPQYFDDPSLPAGKLVQIDFAVGGIKASVTNEIYNADGSLRKKDVFVSNYRPWSAKYRRGTGGQ